MKRYFALWFWMTILAALAAVAGRAALPSPDLIAQIHFAGGPAIAADTNAAAFTNLWCTPEALALRNQTLNKLSHAPYAWLKSKIAAGTGDEAAQLRPLIDDLSSAEWFLQVRDAATGSPELALAIRLDAGRAQLWQSNLKSVLEAWTAMPVTKTPAGWELKKHLPPDLIRLVRVGDWVVVGYGQDALPLNDALVRRVQAEKRPVPADKNAWLTLDLDWPRLSRWLPEFKSLDLPETQLQLAGRDGHLRWNGKLVFSQPLALTLEPWRLPTNTINMPLDSFEAARGIAPWLQKQNWLRPYTISPLPNQMFVWAVDQMPLQTFAAVPVPNGKKALQELEQKLSIHTNWQNRLQMPLTMEATNNQLSWLGVPMAAPNLQAVHEPAGDFLLAGVFPNVPHSQPLPPELLTQIAHGNLVYYHWEVTSERLKQLPQLTQLALMITRHRQLDAQSPAGKWLGRIGPTLGVTVTEVKQTAPNELSLQRKAPAGFTAFELIALANWLEATNFPGCNLDLPPPRHRRPAPRATNAPPMHPPVASPAAPRTAP